MIAVCDAFLWLFMMHFFMMGQVAIMMVYDLDMAGFSMTRWLVASGAFSYTL